MPETGTIPVSASVASTGLGIRYIGNWMYAYSGILSINNNETTMLEFTTGSGLIVAKVQFNYPVNVTDDYTYRMYMNDQVVQAFTAGSGHTDFAQEYFRLVIPPFTIVKATAQNVADPDSNDQIVAITGRVYGAE